MRICPLCGSDPFKGWTGDDMYNRGAWDIDAEKEIKCGSCDETIIMKPHQSIDWEFEEKDFGDE